jgi:hypothetical protein
MGARGLDAASGPARQAEGERRAQPRHGWPSGAAAVEVARSAISQRAVGELNATTRSFAELPGRTANLGSPRHDDQRRVGPGRRSRLRRAAARLSISEMNSRPPAATTRDAADAVFGGTEP